MEILIQLLIGIIGLPLGNFLALMPYFLLIALIAKIFPDRKGVRAGVLSLYLSRFCMGATVSLIYWFALYLFGIESRIIVTMIFGIWTIFLSEPFSENQAHDLLKGDLAKYANLRRNLKIIRTAAYFVVSPLYIILEAAYLR